MHRLSAVDIVIQLFHIRDGGCMQADRGPKVIMHVLRIKKGVYQVEGKYAYSKLDRCNTKRKLKEKKSKVCVRRER
jgi:hypothetical protein